MPVKFSFQMPDGAYYKAAFLRFADTMEESIPTFLDGAARAMEMQAERVFESEGADGKGKWEPLSPLSEEFKARDGFGGMPLLVRTGRLQDALTSPSSPYGMRQVTGNSLVYGTKGLPFASFHQTGTRQRGVTERQQRFLGARYGWRPRLGYVITMPARPPVDFGKGSGGAGGGTNAIGRRFRKDLIEAGRKVILGARQASGLPQNYDAQISRDFDARVEREG